MKVKARNLIELILQTIVFILTFIPGFSVEEHWNGFWEYFPSAGMTLPNYKKTYHEYNSLFAGMFETSKLIEVFGWLLYASIVCGIVAYTFQFVTRGKNRNWKPTLYILGLEIVLLIIHSISINMYRWDSTHDSQYTEYNLQFLFFIVLGVYVLLLAITVLGYIKVKKYGIIEDTPAPPKIEVVRETRNAEELKKYKELLDDGIITQEEFDAKKKQLLGI